MKEIDYTKLRELESLARQAKELCEAERDNIVANCEPKHDDTAACTEHMDRVRGL